MKNQTQSQIEFPVKKYISYYMYTDVQAYEVVRQVSKTKIEVRELDTKAIKQPSEFYAGGFSGHYADNHNQEYEYTTNEQNPIDTIRLSNKGWGKGRWRMGDKPYKFYDFNF